VLYFRIGEQLVCNVYESYVDREIVGKQMTVEAIGFAYPSAHLYTVNSVADSLLGN